MMPFFEPFRPFKTSKGTPRGSRKSGHAARKVKLEESSLNVNKAAGQE